MKQSKREKILIVRFSSIGDIVLTTPVIRSLRACKPDAEIHFLTKSTFIPLLAHNPHLDKVIGFAGDMDATVKELRAEGYDFLIDLHQSMRSRLLRLRLRLPSSVYPKDRWPVLLYTKFRLGRLPERHTVDRYAVAMAALGCKLDGKGIDFFVPKEAQLMASDVLKRHFHRRPVAVALGGLTATKRWPKEYFAELIQSMGKPVVLLGGKSEVADARWIESKVDVPVMVAAGEYDLVLSAAILRECAFAITHDSGFMHIASAFELPIFSIWGNTVPGFGFSPYKAKDAVILEVQDLDCRPCSKLGSDSCPKGHFKCMRDQTPAKVMDVIRGKLSSEFELNSWKSSLEWS